MINIIKSIMNEVFAVEVILEGFIIRLVGIRCIKLSTISIFIFFIITESRFMH